jgi:hypothetical protein
MGFLISPIRADTFYRAFLRWMRFARVGESDWAFAANGAIELESGP